jgi:hypothetical protein
MRRRTRGWALLVLLAGTLPGTATPVEGAPKPVAVLGLGQSAFWSHPKPVDGSGPLAYTLEVSEPGETLRIALDHSDLDNRWVLKVDGPGGTRTVGGNYSMEAFLPGTPGTYTITAEPQSVDGSVVRFRAKLERRAPTEKKHQLLPNLRISPPYDFTLRGGPYYLKLIGSPATVSCFPEETAQSQVVKCLRFTFGPENAGEGPLELIYAAPADHGGQNIMYQQIHLSDGTTVRREAGTYEYHAAHAHFHHPLIAGQQLFEVTDPETGTMKATKAAKKTGFCMGDYALVDWQRFYQDPWATVTSSCGLADLPVKDLVMGLSTGWADMYTYDLEGNYIDFTDGADGLYVVRAYTDQSGEIKETNENDNISYAYIEVTGDDVTLIERGYGQDPWDPNKVILKDPRNFSDPSL